MRTPILKVKKVPSSLAPVAKDPIGGQEQQSAFSMTKTVGKPSRTSTKLHAGMDQRHATPVKAASNKIVGTRQQASTFSQGQATVKQAPRSTTIVKSEISKIKEIIEKEEGLQEVC